MFSKRRTNIFNKTYTTGRSIREKHNHISFTSKDSELDPNTPLNAKIQSAKKLKDKLKKGLQISSSLKDKLSTRIETPREQFMDDGSEKEQRTHSKLGHKLRPLDSDVIRRINVKGEKKQLGDRSIEEFLEEKQVQKGCLNNLVTIVTVPPRELCDRRINNSGNNINDRYIGNLYIYYIYIYIFIYIYM